MQIYDVRFISSPGEVFYSALSFQASMLQTALDVMEGQSSPSAMEVVQKKKEMCENLIGLLRNNYAAIHSMADHLLGPKENMSNVWINGHYISHQCAAVLHEALIIYRRHNLRGVAAAVSLLIIDAIKKVNVREL